MGAETNAHDRARVVRRYLSALDASRPGRSPGRTAESLVFRMHQIDTELLSADPVRRLHLTQERIDLHAEHLRLQTAKIELDELAKAFVRVARAYSDRHAISYSAWRQVGVDADVLAQAGIVQNKPARPAPVAPAAAAEPEPELAPAVTAEPTPEKKLKAVAKKAPTATKRAAAAKNGATKAVKKTDAPLPAEAHLLS